MKNKFHFVSQFNWKILLLRFLINGLALILVGLLTPNVYFINRTLGSILLAALILGVLNTFIKPVLLFLTGQLFFATFGFLVIVINAALLYLLEWLLPNSFSVNGLFWALVAGAILGLVSNGLENLLGLAPPIVPEGQADFRREIRERSVTPLQTLAGIPPATMAPNVDTQSLEEIQAARAMLDVINGVAAPAAPIDPLEKISPLEPAASPDELRSQEEAAGPKNDTSNDTESSTTGGQA